jgi:outer membrane protein
VKNLSLILNIVLAFAIGVLYFLHFSSRSTLNENLNSAEADLNQKSPLKIAYINSDTLLKHYDFFKDAAEKLDKKREKLEADFSNRARGLQTEVQNFQRNAQSMTINQARATEEELVKKEQNLYQYRDNLSQQLMKDEADVNNELYENVSAFLKEYGKKNNLEVVLTYQKGSGVLYASDSLDITYNVIKGLNEDYTSKKTAEPVVEKDVKAPSKK